MSPTMQTAQRYGAIAITLHWVLAVALLCQIALGWWMLDLPKSPPGVRAGWFNVHKSIGITLGVVVVLRLLWRRRHPPPPHKGLSRWQQRAASGSHALLYACMVVLPVSGYLGSVFSGYPVRYFGLVLPAWTGPWPAAKSFLSTLHFTTVCVFMALIALHVAAALWHWWRRDGITDRMGLPALPKVAR